jgi:hypothetical protein
MAAFHRPFSRTFRHLFPASATPSRGYVLFEALISLAVVGLGALPLAMLGTVWLRWTNEQESLTAALWLAAEQAEVGEARALSLPLISGEASLVSRCQTTSADGACIPGNRLAVAVVERRAAEDVSGLAALPARVALWVTP